MSYDTRAELQISNIAFERNYQWLFRNITTRLTAGETLQVAGANGTGKSTLLRLLAGYVMPAEGDIIWQQQSISQLQSDYQQQLHYLGHLNGLKPALTVMENLRVNMALAGEKFDDALALEILKKLALEKHASKPVTQLSAGQCRRTALARLLLNPRQLWLLDEPTTALDAQGQELLAQFLAEHSARGGMTVLVAHQELGLTAKKIIL